MLYQSNISYGRVIGYGGWVDCKFTTSVRVGSTPSSPTAGGSSRGRARYRNGLDINRNCNTFSKD